MRAVIQRVGRAEITIDHRETRSIGQGLVVFLGVMKGDTDKQADFLAEKVQGLRVFTDAEGKMNLSLEDTGGELLVVSNFTLGTDCKKGRRPSFDLAAPPEEAERLYRHFVERAKALGIRKLETGEFGAYMEVLCQNDGPVNLFIDTEKIGK